MPVLAISPRRRRRIRPGEIVLLTLASLALGCAAAAWPDAAAPWTPVWLAAEPEPEPPLATPDLPGDRYVRTR